MISCEISEIFKKNCLEEHLPTDKQKTARKSHFFGKKKESHLVNLSRGQRMLPENYSYFNSTQLLNFIPLDNEWIYDASITW